MSELGDSIAKTIFDGIDEWMSQECAKIKARDIVPGWPKPRSSSCWSYDALWSPWVPSSGERLADERETRAYHEAQKRMFDNFLEEWRTPDAPNEWGRLRKWVREGGRIAQ